MALPGNVTSKLANKIQKNLNNLLNVGSVGKVGPGGGQDMAQVNATFARILNKSPLELNDTSPAAHMTENPYDYATVYYPNNVQTLESGHYIIFDVLEKDTLLGQSLKSLTDITGQGSLGIDINDYGDGAFKTIATGPAGQNNRITRIKNRGGGTEERVVNLSSGIAGSKLFNRPVRISKTIVLYTPPGLKTSYNTVHEGVETGIVGNLLGFKGGGTIRSASELVARLKDAAAALGTDIISGIAALIPGIGDVKGALSKVTGKATNPNIEMVFRSVPMRSFDFVFEFAPKNRKELENMYKIIEIFKFHMHPAIDGLGNDFIVPDEFQITYMYLEHRNQYIPRVSRCVLTNLDIQHGDEGNFSTFAGDYKGAAPIYTKMSLKFSETEIMTKTTISKGF